MTENLSDLPGGEGEFTAAIEAVEQLPLEDRAEGYAQIYENVRAKLERPETSGSNS